MDRKRRATAAPTIPDKHTFKIGEVSRIAGVKPHVLRYWETEFPTISPRKSASNQRLYRRRDVETVLTIKQLLYQEGYTIAGANKRLRELSRRDRRATDDELKMIFGRLRSKVEELLEVVENDDVNEEP